MATLTRQQRNAMNSRDEQFFRELDARIALARKERQLAEQLGIAQQTMAHYEGGQLKVLAQILNLSLDELLGLPARRTAKRGPASRLELQIDAIRQMAMTKQKQKFVSEMLDNVIGKTE